MVDAPAPRQLEVLRTIEAHRRQHGHSPTIVELGRELGIASNNGVVDHLKALTRKGLLTWLPRRARTLALTPAGLRWLGVLVLSLVFAGCDVDHASRCADSCSRAGLQMAAATSDSCTCLTPPRCELEARASAIALDRADVAAAVLSKCSAALTACETRGGR